MDTTNVIRSDIDRRKRQVNVANERAELTTVKAQQYEEAVDELHQRVRNTGLAEKTTHDAVLNDTKLLTDLEQQLPSTSKWRLDQIPWIATCKFEMTSPP